MALRHRKSRNVPLMFEALVRYAAACVVEGKKDELGRVSAFLRRHFSDGPLVRERELFEAVRGARQLSEPEARRVLRDVQERACLSDPRRLDLARKELYKEATAAFPGFLERRLSDYRLYASVHMVLEGVRRDVISETVDRARLEEAVVRYMTTSDPVRKVMGGEERVDVLVLELATKKFRERTSQEKLSDGQRSLLEAYLRSAEDRDEIPLRKRLDGERVRLSAVLAEGLKSPEARADAVLRERLEEAGRILPSVSSMKAEPAVEETMRFMRLAEELESQDV